MVWKRPMEKYYTNKENAKATDLSQRLEDRTHLMIRDQDEKVTDSNPT
jgi:hypothetical protein